MKSEFRHTARLIRENIKDREAKTSLLNERLYEFLKDYQNVALYASIRDELCLDEVINKLLSDNKDIYLPKVEGNVINFNKIKTLDELKVQGKLLIREPIDGLLGNDLIEVVIVPGLAFDESKNRLGYGKGYYDKFLNGRDVFKVGVCFDEQIFKNIPSSEDDIKMDIIMSDKRIIK